MQVVVVSPYGYCSGVLSAISLALKAKKDNPSTPVYLLGMLVHNEDAVKMLSGHGLLLLDERVAPLERELREVKPGSVLIFSAHGHPEGWESIARERNLKIIDASCRFVKENLIFGKEAASSNPLIYIGVRGHLESEAFLSNVRSAAFYDVKTNKFEKEKVHGEQPIVISQTTLSYLELEEAHKEIKKLFPKALIGKERCHSTSFRQDAIKKLDKDIDMVIILGSKLSNNSKKLEEIAKSEGFEARLVLDEQELRSLDLGNIKKVALASGASTSKETFLACKAYLESL